MTAAQSQAQLELFRDNLPPKAYSCDVFEKDNAVRRIERAITKKYIQPNSFNSKSWLIFDIDYAVTPEQITDDICAPEPTLFVSNPANGHAHVFYLLKTAVHANSHSSQRALKYAAAIEVGLAQRLNADMTYGALLAKNALNEAWRVFSTTTKPVAYELSELAEYVDLNVLGSSANDDDNLYGLNRNYTLFERLRTWAYKAIRQTSESTDFSSWYEACLSRGEGINAGFKSAGLEPLAFGEIKSTAKSVAKFTHKHFDSHNFSLWQSANGKRSGEVRRKNSITERKPWEALGISRATWYRRRK